MDAVITVPEIFGNTHDGFLDRVVDGKIRMRRYIRLYRLVVDLVLKGIVGLVGVGRLLLQRMRACC